MTVRIDVLDRNVDVSKKAIKVTFKIEWEDSLIEKIRETLIDVAENNDIDLEEINVERIIDDIDVSEIKEAFYKNILKELSIDFRVLTLKDDTITVETKDVDEIDTEQIEQIVDETIELIEAIAIDTLHNTIASMLLNLIRKENESVSKTNETTKTETVTKEENRTETELGVRKLQVTRDDARICIPIDYLRMLYIKYNKVPAKFKVLVENDRLILEPVWDSTLDSEKLLKLRILNL